MIRALGTTALLTAVAAGSASAGLIGWDQATFATNGTSDGTAVVQGASAGITYETAWSASAGDVAVNGVNFLADPTTTAVTITATGSASAFTGLNAGAFSGNFQTLMGDLYASGGGASWTVNG